MKKIIVSIATLCSITAFSQTTEIYTYKNGVREVTPSVVIYDDKVYTVKDGVRDFIPVLVVEDNKVYEVNPNTAVREITPTLEIKIDVTLPQ